VKEVVMATRLWTALLMLFGVFAMHGLQCTSAADGAHASGAAHTTSVVAPAAPAAVDSPVAGIPTAAMATAQAGTASMAAGHPGAEPAAAGHPTALGGGGYGSPPHGSAGHLWTLCLAVLAAGIAVLLALLVHRLVELVSPALPRGRAHAAGWLPPSRPPDLFALCILRT
jgi:hypothetical protein